MSGETREGRLEAFQRRLELEGMKLALTSRTLLAL